MNFPKISDPNSEHCSGHNGGTATTREDFVFWNLWFCTQNTHTNLVVVISIYRLAVPVDALALRCEAWSVGQHDSECPQWVRWFCTVNVKFQMTNTLRKLKVPIQTYWSSGKVRICYKIWVNVCVIMSITVSTQTDQIWTWRRQTECLKWTRSSGLVTRLIKAGIMDSLAIDDDFKCAIVIVIPLHLCHICGTKR